MDTWNGTDQEAREIFHDFFQQEYEKLTRCAIIYLKLKIPGAHVSDWAEDIVQEMFSLAWERREEVLSSEKPVGWLYEALHYKVKEHLNDENKWVKRLCRYREFYVPPAEPHISLEIELGGIVPKEDFDLLYKIYVMGYSYRELYEELGLTKPTLATKIHRIKEKIRKKLDE